MFRFPFSYFLFLLLGRNCSHFGNSTFRSRICYRETGETWIDVWSRGKEMHGPGLPTSRKHAS